MKNVIKILVVDDEKNVCDSVSKVLIRRGYKVDFSLNAEDAVGRIEKIPYHLIILDIMMPRINGVDLLKTINQQYRECNVIMITGYASIRTAVETTQLGALAYISKPFTPEELLDAVERAMKEKPRSIEFCEKGRLDCKKFVKSGPCKDECLLRKGAKGAGKKAKAGGLNGKIDVDIPYDFDEVEQATSGTYAQTLSRSDMPIIGWQRYYERNNKVLIVDDEVAVCNSIRKVLSRKNYEIDNATSGNEAMSKLSGKKYALVLLDLRLPDVSGMELLKQIRSKWPEAEVVIITGYASIDTAVESTQLGAVNYIAKPFTPEELSNTVDYAMAWKAA